MSMIARSLSKINEMINNVFEAKSFKSNNNTRNSLTEGAVVLNGVAGAIVLDDNGGKRISWNDGGGNFQLRSGNYFNGAEKFVGNNGAATITLNSDASNGNILFKVANKGTDGANIVWGHSLLLDNGGLKLNNNKIWHAGNDGSGSGLDADKLQGHGAITFMNNLGTSVGTQSTTGYIQAGRGSGGVSLTHNDGYGNANVTFNHQAGIPEQDGNAARIEVNTDSTTGAAIWFKGKSGVTGGNAIPLENWFVMSSTGATCLGNKVWHSGDCPISKATNGYQKLPSGLIIQWGKTSTAAIPDGGTYTVTLPIVFPTAFITAVVSSNSRNAYNVSTGAGGAENTYNTSQFTVVAEAGATNGANWIAIGY